MNSNFAGILEIDMILQTNYVQLILQETFKN